MLKKTKRSGYLQIIAPAVWFLPCISMNLGAFVQWSFVVIKDVIVFFIYVIQSLKSGKTRKVTLFPFRGRKTLWIYSWCSLPDIEHDQKYFVILLYTWRKRKPQPHVTIIRNWWNYSGKEGGNLLHYLEF